MIHNKIFSKLNREYKSNNIIYIHIHESITQTYSKKKMSIKQMYQL